MRDLKMSRRETLGLASVLTATVAFGASQAVGSADAQASRPPAAPTNPGAARRQISRAYRKHSQRAGGTWSSCVTVPDADGGQLAAVEENVDEKVEAYSVNKIAVAAAVLDKVDRGLLTLTQRVDVTADIIVTTGDGIFRLDGAYPSSVTVGHALAALLTISDDTAVRLCGLVCPAAELNEILRGKGFVHTQVVPVANPNRFFLGTTTPRETQQLLDKLVAGTLVSAASTTFVLDALRAPIAFTDGIRRVMSSAERLRIATKAGWFADGRNEAGIMFDDAGLPILTYALFARGQDDADNFGATHPVVQARSEMGRAFLDAVSPLDGPTSRMAAPVPQYQPYNGG